MMSGLMALGDGERYEGAAGGGERGRCEGEAGGGDLYAQRGEGDGGFVALMGGVDAVVFTGGIGEHDARSRAEIVEGMQSFGVSD